MKNKFNASVKQKMKLVLLLIALSVYWYIVHFGLNQVHCLNLMRIKSPMLSLHLEIMIFVTCFYTVSAVMLSSICICMNRLILVISFPPPPSRQYRSLCTIYMCIQMKWNIFYRNALYYTMKNKFVCTRLKGQICSPARTLNPHCLLCY